jgi:hypothetical protein
MLVLHLLFSASHGIVAPVAITTTTVLTYALGACLRSTNMCAAHRLLARAAVPLAFLALVATKVFGWIGTLTHEFDTKRRKLLIHIRPASNLPLQKGQLGVLGRFSDLQSLQHFGLGVVNG